MPLEEIAELCGHSCPAVTRGYRHQLKALIAKGADAVFGPGGSASVG
ncbi:hypothetical protein [Actinomadura roseirufa]|nr:hypothetical protein [Actinomadura roseirufa]